MKFCEKCGKELLDEAVICPGCGCEVTLKQKSIETQVVPKQAKYAFVFGILSLLLLAPFGILAIILAVKSKEQTGGIMCKKAKTGLVCGIIGLCFWGLNLLLLL